MNTAATTRSRRGRPGHDADAVLRVAVRVFTERGYDRTTMDDVAAALGLSKSSIYHHVSGKGQLLERALDTALGALEAALAKADVDTTPLLRLQSAVRGSVQVLVAELPFVTLLLRVRGNTAVERDALRRRRAIDSRFAELVRAAQNDGSLRADLEPDLVSRLVFGTVNSLIEWYRPARGLDAEQLADAVVSMLFEGLTRG
ncbi:TetR/AcrR family transcriptional regulator [Nakamurella aerolata]|uniref:TetR/AcrR family transcriptional regulator n=1 Tax=Nakamurella aerolata TaxID=1656892 RepID=A0A849AAY6_9ACTN|nr:TetR/AcrR family transcriptional regulator [Nakamurella aerolata]NNG37107.1 TetR/AcrR family transcriptional regulator [Nakamurella aerolata]